MPLHLVSPRVQPPLDENFRPAILANQNFRREIGPIGGAVNSRTWKETEARSRVLKQECFRPLIQILKKTFQYVERIVKFLLWQRGGHTLYVGNSTQIAEYLREVYSAKGARKFDYDFMGGQVYEQPLKIISCDLDKVPASRETGKFLGRNLQGHRIGFDLGASDRKVSAVVDGTPVYSEEVVWEPRKHTDPEYHYREIMTALKTAASKMPRVDAIGGSSGGYLY